MQIREVLTAPRSPWQNAYVERLIGSIRRDCLDHILVLTERGLRRILKSYFDYYERSRTYLELVKDAPVPRPTPLRPETGSLPLLVFRTFFQAPEVVILEPFRRVHHQKSGIGLINFGPYAAKSGRIEFAIGTTGASGRLKRNRLFLPFLRASKPIS
jgi:transposase InsO family protein